MKNKNQETEKVGLLKKIKKFFACHPRFAEICRFIIVGGVATLIDFLVMGLTEFLIENDKYAGILNIFFNSPELKTSTVIIGTAVGFVVGLIFNYVFSIIFVYAEKGTSKSVKGFLVFTFLSIVGLMLNMFGMFLLYDKLHINQWVAKVFVTCVVLAYNYVSRKYFIFSKKQKIEKVGNELTKEKEIIENKIDKIS